MSKKDRIIELIKQGKTNKEIIKIVGGNTVYVSMLRKRYTMEPSLKQIDWNAVQLFYDDNHSINETAKFFNVGFSRIAYAARHGIIQTRTASEALKIAKSKKPFMHSDETKEHLRKIRIKFMQDHPEQTAWSRKWKHEKSWPEKIFEDELNRRNITGWIYNHRSGIYQYDFGFPDLKLDVEIDGNWHNTEKQKLKDKLRDEYTLMNGWIVIRFQAKEINENLSGCVDRLEEFIKNWRMGESVNPSGFEPED